MKIVHLLASEHLGGAETMCLQLCRSLQEAGHSVSVFSFARGDVAKRAHEWGIRFDAVELPRSYESRGKKWHRMSLHLAEYVRAERPDIVHSHLPITNVLCHSLRRRLTCPWVCTIHGSWRLFGYSVHTVQRPWLRPLLAARHAVGDWWTTRSAARVVAISNYVAAELSRVGVSRRRICTVYNGLDNQGENTTSRAEARVRLGIAQQEILLSAVGFLSPVKGFDLLIRAFGHIAGEFPTAKCLIVGRGILDDRTVSDGLAAQIQAAGLADRCSVYSRAEALHDTFAASDVFVVPSRSEGFSLVLLQAMQAGLPAVVTSAGGCAEVARDGRESLVYQSPNVGDMAAKLRQIVSDASLRRQLGNAARARAADFGIDRCVRSYVSVYETVLNERR